MNKPVLRKMNYGVKISHKGFSVTDLDKERSAKAISKKVLPHLLSNLALPYLLGAKTQVERYVFAASQLKIQPSIATMGCLHEAVNRPLRILPTRGGRAGIPSFEH